ncbi:MAG: leucine-rich repeat domain-containing protein [Clostridia bacterium]|nr:leucine-rich repeat domain-containing protein [Clostridia bacterium]
MMTFTITLPAFAEDATTPETQTEQNLSYNSSNALGDTIVNAIEEENAVRDEYDGKGIFNVSLVGLEATVALSAPDDCTVVVSVYEEETMQMVTSGKADVSSDDMEVVVTLADFELPDFFVVKAFILNSINAPVCPEYVNLDNTRLYVESLSKTTEDFEADMVINLDESTEDNFAVVTEDAVVSEVKEEKNIIVSVDDENGIYVIENADDSIKSMHIGEVLYLTYGEGEDDYILTKIGNIETEDNITTITASDDYEISDFFDYIDIDTSKKAAPQTYSMRRDFNEDAGDVEEEIVYELDCKEKTFKGDNYSVKLALKGEVGFHVVFLYDIKWGKDTYKFEYWVRVKADATADFNFNYETQAQITLIDQDFFVVTGLDIHLKLSLTIKVNAEFNAHGVIGFEIKAGAKRESGKKQEPINYKKLTFNVDADGKFSVDIIPEIETGFRVIKVFFVDLNVPVVFNVSGTLFIPTTQEEIKKHSCFSCIAGVITVKVNADISVKFGLHRKNAISIINIKPDGIESKLGDFYVAFKSDTEFEFGWGTCPNNKTGTTVTPPYEPDDDLPVMRPGGKCGDNASWIITEYGELRIFGSGPMYDYDESGPWNAYDDQIYSVVIGDGITYIGKNAFSELNHLYDVTLGAKVETIGDYAFDFCYGLTRIKLNNGLKTIGSMAFSNTSIEVLDVPASVTTFGEWPFDMMYCLTDINVNSGNQKYSSKNGVLFNKDQRTLIYYPQGREATTYSIPDSVVNIGDYAFASARYLTSVTFGRNVTTIGDSAFDRSSLTSVSLSGKIKTIGGYAFSGCSDLKSVYVGEKVSTIDYSTFSYSDKLSSITISSYNPYYTTLNNVIYDKAMTTLIYCPSMHTGTFTVPAGVKVIGEDAFDNLSPLTRVVLSSEVEIIKDSAFSNMDELEEIVIPKSVKTIEQYAFYNCDALKYVRYTGSSSQWSKISIDYWNDDLKYASRTYNYNPVNATAAVMSLSPDDKLSAYSASNVQSETITDAVVDSDYILIAVKDASAEDLHAPSNLLYIDQKRAESEELTFEYVIDESVTDYDVLVFGQKLPHYHLYDETITTYPTCTETGVKTFTCECGDSYTEEIDIIDHEYESAVTAPTCTEQGFTTYTCSCGDSYVADYVDATGHADEVIPGYGATCTETGLTDGVKCSVCGEVTSEQEIIPVIEHDDSDSDGYCDECGEDLTVNCSHSCHSDGFIGFFWKIINFLQKLFGVQSARYCECGVDHWSK